MMFQPVKVWGSVESGGQISPSLLDKDRNRRVKIDHSQICTRFCMAKD
jgi:hypothetical protein